MLKKIFVFCLSFIMVLTSLNVFADATDENLISTAVRVWASSDAQYATAIGNAYDGKNSTILYVKKESQTVGGWFAVELASPSIITEISLTMRSDKNGSLGECSGFVFEVANKEDFSDASVLYENTTPASNLVQGQVITYTHSNMETAYKYVRVRRKSVSVICFAEFSVKGYRTYISTENIINSPSEQYYALIFDAISEKEALLNITNNSVPSANVIIKNSGSDFYTTHYQLIKLNSGENKISINNAKGNTDLKNVRFIPLPDITDNFLNEFTDEVNASVNAVGVKETLVRHLEDFGVDISEITCGVFYDIPIYENILDREYESADEIITDILKFSALEKNDPTVIITKNGEVQTHITSGDYVVTVKSKRLSNSCKVVVAVYNEDSLSAVGHTLSNASGVVTIPITVNLLGTGDVGFKVMYISDFDTLRPIDAYPKVYEDIYMSASGSDDGDGSKQNPYLTLDAVKSKIAQINDAMTGDIVVHVEDGIYPVTETITFTEEHGGKNGYNVIVTGDEIGENPVFTGGMEVTGWQEYGNGIYRAPLDVDFDVRNLYVNGYSAHRARSAYKYVLEEFYDDPDTDYSKDGFYMSGDGINAFLNPNELELVWNLSWQAHRTPVDDIELSEDGRYLFRMSNPCFSTEANVNVITIKQNSEFYIENSLELLDEEGEFYYDKSGDYIYYKPYPEEILSQCEVCVPVTEILFDIGGVSASSKIENIVFKNLDIRLGAWNKVSQSGLVGIQADSINATDDAGTRIIPYQFTVRNADGIRITDCNFSDMGSGALAMTEGVTNSFIERCSFTDISAGAVSIGSASRTSVTETNKCANISVKNNLFRRVASQYHQTVAISAYYGNGFVIRNNDIKRTPYTAVNVGWGWESHGESNTNNTYPPDGCGYYVVSDNSIADSMLVLRDGASIYSLDHGPTVIKDNYIVNSFGLNQYGIYPDSSARNTMIENNVIENSARWLNVGVGYIKDIIVRDNYSTNNNYSCQSAEKEKNTIEDAIIIDDTNNLHVQSVISSSGLESDYSSMSYETPHWRKENIDTLPKWLRVGDAYFCSSITFDSYCQPARATERISSSGLSFNSGEWVSYELPYMENGTYTLRVTGAKNGSSSARYKVYVNDNEVLNTSFAATGSWGTFESRDAGTITINASSTKTIKFKITSEGFIFGSFQLDKIN